MITIINDQKAITVNTEQLQRDAQTMLDALGYSDFDLGVKLVTDTAMHTLNNTYRHKDKSTDILSFPYHPDAKPEETIIAHTQDDKNLGDIIIAPHYVTDDLARWGQTFDERMKLLLVHGICHLLGYDHIEDADYEVMKVKEEQLLQLIN